MSPLNAKEQFKAVMSAHRSAMRQSRIQGFNAYCSALDSEKKVVIFGVGFYCNNHRASASTAQPVSIRCALYIKKTTGRKISSFL